MLNKKYIIIISILVILDLGLIYSVKSHRYKFDYSQGTGAIISRVSYKDDDPYAKLYDLLDIGEVKNKYFILKTEPKKRLVKVNLLEPKEESLKQFNLWLTENGFENVPKNKIVFE